MYRACACRLILFDDLLEIATGLVPELLAENRVPTQAAIPLHIVAERTMIARAA